MKRTTIEFMVGWLDALRRDDVQALKATLAPDVVWQGLRDDWACQGSEAVIHTFAGEREAKQEIGALELIGSDDHAILHASGGDVVAIEDVPLPDGIYSVFTLDAGTITRIDDYADRHDALTAAGLGNPKAAPQSGAVLRVRRRAPAGRGRAYQNDRSLPGLSLLTRKFRKKNPK